MSDHRASPHLLVVDDDRLVLASLARGLRQAGYRVSVAANGEDAFAMARKEPPDLALLDVRMPGISGLELGRTLRDKAGVPFLYLSAYGDHATVKQATDEGALGYLVKPLDIQQIVPEIEAALARGRDIRKLRESEAQLNTALTGSRDISTAVGLLMMRDRLVREQAFELLRSYARSQRRAVSEVAKELLKSAENLNAVGKLEHQSPRRKRRDA